MTKRPTGREVFVQAVADALAGTPHANHPVQFRPSTLPDAWVCTLCQSLVLVDDRDAHREWHDAHVQVHDEILAEAIKYSEPRRYGGNFPGPR